MNDKKKSILLITVGGVLILLLGFIAVYSLINNNLENDNNDNINGYCNRKVTGLNNEVLGNTCSEYSLNINDNLDIQASLIPYDGDGHYILKLIVNNINVTTDFFTNKDKKAIFDNVYLTTYQDYVIVKSDTGAQWNGQYLAVINKDGNVLFTYEDAQIGISNDTVNIEKVKQLTSGVECKCDGKTSDNNTIISTSYTYKIKDNKVSLQSTKDTTCADQCLTD